MKFVSLIKQYHRNQFDSQEAPYWLHPYRVSFIAVKIARTYNRLQIHHGLPTVDIELVHQTALLHDVFEDTTAGPSEVDSDGFDTQAVKLALFDLNFKHNTMSYKQKIQKMIDDGKYHCHDRETRGQSRQF